jgi:predicted ester cyclase
MTCQQRTRPPVKLCTPGFTAQFPGSPTMDLEGFDQFEAMIRSAFRRSGTRSRTWSGEGDEIAVHLRMEGTHTGDFMGVPASGKQFSVEGTAFLRIAGGKLTQFWGFLDQLGLMQQIGAARARPGQVNLASRSAPLCPQQSPRRSQRPTEFPSRASERISNGQVEPNR